MSSIAASFWDFWAENHKVNFDGANKIVTVSSEVTSLDIQIELFSDWKEWIKLRQNTKYDAAMRSIGGDPTTGVNFAGDSYFMVNNWRVIVDLTKVRITGILFSDNFESAWLDVDGITPVFPAEVASLVNRVGTDVQATASAVWEQTSQSGNTYKQDIETIRAGGNGLTTTQVNQLADIFVVLGLDPTKPLIVTPSTIAAGSVVQTITGNPVSSSVVTRI